MTTDTDHRIEVFQSFLNDTGHLEYYPDLNMYRWRGPLCPPVGLYIPSDLWGNVVYPRLTGSIYTGDGAFLCQGGLAQLEWYNPATGLSGEAAWGPDGTPPELREDEERGSLAPLVIAALGLWAWNRRR